ncbi:hypothetical protein GA0070618_5378 [Micromonospora echinospora]|uniref:Uncharacterized protein n=1 Tax=Micromonospora echinospora TaxID=1877 RepID=A0A1C4ZKH3_MICEC|nr:hypothetical protein GA0070618_5378 [Micromonospora echinospora]
MCDETADLAEAEGREVLVLCAHAYLAVTTAQARRGNPGRVGGIKLVELKVGGRLVDVGQCLVIT